MSPEAQEGKKTDLRAMTAVRAILNVSESKADIVSIRHSASNHRPVIGNTGVKMHREQNGSWKYRKNDARNQTLCYLENLIPQIKPNECAILSKNAGYASVKN